MLGLEKAWTVTEVRLDMERLQVDVHVEHNPSELLSCPECGKACGVYDHREMRTWRHLDTMQFKTELHCEVPRIKCAEHGVKTARAPWAEKNSPFTLLFESFAVTVLQSCKSVEAARRLLKVNWHQLDGIRKRAVERGLRRRNEIAVPEVGVDEKSFRKGHRYVSILTDIGNKRVLDVVEGRDEAATKRLFGCLSQTQREGVEAIAMDMWKAFINAGEAMLPNAQIVHDRFHISKYLNEAIDKVRRQEHKELMQKKDERLKGAKYVFLRGFENMSEAQQLKFTELMAAGLKVGKAYGYKETFDEFWTFTDEAAARKHFKDWYNWSIRSKMQPVKKVARMIKANFERIITFIQHRITNATAEGLNSSIQIIKANARGFKSFENYRIAILFQCGGLDLQP